MKIQPIVEGYGEVEAFPVLLRRLVDEAQAWSVGIGRPIRRSRVQLVREDEVVKAVRLGLLQQDCHAVLILLDGNSDCPAELGPTVQAWAAAAAGNVPCGVVIAHREYEAWFLAAIESLRGHHGIRDDAESLPDGKSSWCKGVTGETNGCSYKLYGAHGPTGIQQDVLIAGCVPPVEIVPKARQFIRALGTFHGAGHRCVASRGLGLRASCAKTRPF